MKHFKLKLGLSFIPFFDFVILLFWGMFEAYGIARKRSHAFIYALVCMGALFVACIPFWLGVYFFTNNADLSNTALYFGIMLSLVYVWCFALSWVCIGVGHFACKKLTEQQNKLYLE